MNKFRDFLNTDRVAESDMEGEITTSDIIDLLSDATQEELDEVYSFVYDLMGYEDEEISEVISRKIKKGSNADRLKARRRYNKMKNKIKIKRNREKKLFANKCSDEDLAAGKVYHKETNKCTLPVNLHY